MFSTDDTIVAIATPPGRAGLGVVRLVGPAAGDRGDRSRRTSHLAIASTPRRAPACGDRRGRRASVTARGGDRPGRPHLLRRRRRRTPATTSSRSPRTAARSCSMRIVRSAMAAGARLAAAGRVHAARVPQRQARSGAGGGGRRPDRRGDAGAGAPGLRSARWHAERTRSPRSARRLFDLRVRLEASLDFPDEGYHFVEPGEVAEECEAVARHVSRAARDGAREGGCFAKAAGWRSSARRTSASRCCSTRCSARAARSSRRWPARRAIC